MMEMFFIRFMKRGFAAGDTTQDSPQNIQHWQAQDKQCCGNFSAADNGQKPQRKTYKKTSSFTQINLCGRKIVFQKTKTGTGKQRGNQCWFRLHNFRSKRESKKCQGTNHAYTAHQSIQTIEQFSGIHCAQQPHKSKEISKKRYMVSRSFIGKKCQ